MPSPNWEAFSHSDPAGSDAYRGLVKTALAGGALDATTKELLYALLLGVQGYGPGMRSHLDKLLAQGMTPEALREAVRVVLPACGIARFLPLVPVVEEAIAAATSPSPAR
ncbi:MAG: carboxymuconolactone decarboxylase family protein [Alphaproteobacteria bacterium]|nr:carboxymuconolactone decarboxylase family protein [Alphaproteobacteria bacterium]